MEYSITIEQLISLLEEEQNRWRYTGNMIDEIEELTFSEDYIAIVIMDEDEERYE